MAFKYLSPEWEVVRDMIYSCGTNLQLGYCNALATNIVENWVGANTDLLRIVTRNFSLKEVPEKVQNKIKEYLICVEAMKKEVGNT